MNKHFEFGNIKPFHYFFSVSAFLGLVFSLVSDNERYHYVMHLVLWLLQTTGPIVLLVYSHLFLHKFSWFSRNNPWLQLLISGLVGAVLFSPFALCLDLLWGNDLFPKTAHQAYLLWLNELTGVVPPVTLSWLAINAPWILGFRVITNEKGSENNDVIPSTDFVESNTKNSKSLMNASGSKRKDVSQTGFFALLDPAIGTDVVYIKSELHYLKVVTAKGKALVLYNLSDAIADFPEGAGTQTHRSFWVNYSHIEKLRTQGRQGILALSNNEEIPVSRTRLKSFSRFKHPV